MKNNPFKPLITLFLISILLASTAGIAREPINLSIVKNKLRYYHDSGTYIDDISDVTQKAIRYLDLRIRRKDFKGKPAIVLDIDETSLSNYPDMVRLNFGGTLNNIRQLEEKGQDKPILPVLKLYRYTKAHHIAVFFLTGRQEEERKITEANLKQAGYLGHDGLIMRHGKYQTMPASLYKTAMRKQLEKQGYDILLNLGDQKSDLRGGYADKIFKLPNPYYLIP